MVSFLRCTLKATVADLVRAIAERYRVNTESIVTAAGTSFANHLAMAALVQPGEEVLFEQPAYEPMLATVRYLGADVKRFSRRFENDFRVDLAEVEAHISDRTRLVVITNLHNPSGVLIDQETLRGLGRLARSVGAHVLIDEVYIETLFEDQPRTSFHLGPEFVVTSSLTKAFGLSGLRCGWILAQPDLVERMWLLNDLFASTPVHSGERLSVLAFQQIEEIAVNARALLERNKRLVDEFLDTREDLQVVRPEFGTVRFPRVINGTSDALCDLLRKKYDTSVVPGRFFEMPAHFRLGIAGDSGVLEKGLERVGAALDELS